MCSFVACRRGRRARIVVGLSASAPAARRSRVHANLRVTLGVVGLVGGRINRVGTTRGTNVWVRLTRSGKAWVGKVAVEVIDGEDRWDLNGSSYNGDGLDGKDYDCKSSDS